MPEAAKPEGHTSEQNKFNKFRVRKRPHTEAAEVQRATAAKKRSVHPLAAYR